MPKKKRPSKILSLHRTVRPLFLVALIATISLSVLALFIIKTKELAYDTAFLAEPEEQSSELTESFPVSVDPALEVIDENPQVEIYFNKNIASNAKKKERDGWLHRTLALLTKFDWYQNLASPISRILVVDSGERKEEIAANFGGILRWSDEEELAFASLVAGSSPEVADGKFLPGHYVVNKDATPQEVAQMLISQFGDQVLSRYTDEVSAVVPLKDALTIASLLEREAYDFNDMRYIAGIIWNRLFIDMNLQLDASLQYAKSNNGGDSWWPTVHPDDKYIDSPFNTYQNPGLPPSPIANPSMEAILAALNPRETDCIFYFHDADAGFHCSETYEEHVRLLKQYYGRGR